MATTVQSVVASANRDGVTTFRPRHAQSHVALSTVQTLGTRKAFVCGYEYH